MSDEDSIEELTPQQRELDKLIEDNEASYEQLRQEVHRMTGGQGSFSIDTVGPQLEFLIEALMEHGVLTREQVVDMQIKLHTKVKEALEDQWVRVRNAKGRQQLAVPRGARSSKPTLLGPGGQPISST